MQIDIIQWMLSQHMNVESSWNVMAHGDAREGKWRGNWRMEWVDSTLYITSEHGVSSITTADPHTSAASSRLNWRPRRFKWTRLFRQKTKCGFCACHHISNAVYHSTAKLLVTTEQKPFKMFNIFNYALHPFKAYCAICFRRSNFCHQASPRVSPRESTQRRKVELWARNVREFCLNADFHVTFRYLLHAVKLQHGTDGFTSPPKEGVLRIFSP
jgi:hypothetical protein